MRATRILMTIAIAVGFSTAANAARNQMEVSIKKEDVDLDTRTITFRVNRACDIAELKIYDLDGNLLAEKIETYDSAPAGQSLTISWPEPIQDAENFKIELKISDADEFWVMWEIVHIYGLIPHEEVVFESGKWDIRPTEAPKLDEVIPKILEMLAKFKRFGGSMDYGLYVAGFTDTVGSLSDNRELSRKRANAIAEYLISNGLQKQKISISIRGFGEEALAVETGDSVDEERNRRADYIISNFPPKMAGPGSWVKIK